MDSDTSVGTDENDNNNSNGSKHRPDVTGRRVMRDLSIMKTIVSRSIDYLESHSLKDCSQLLRESAPLSKVRELELQFYNIDDNAHPSSSSDAVETKRADPNLDEVDSPVIVSSLLLAVLKDMPEPIVPFENYDDIIHVFEAAKKRNVAEKEAQAAAAARELQELDEASAVAAQKNKGDAQGDNEEEDDDDNASIQSVTMKTDNKKGASPPSKREMMRRKRNQGNEKLSKAIDDDNDSDSDDDIKGQKQPRDRAESVALSVDSVSPSDLIMLMRKIKSESRALFSKMITFFAKILRANPEEKEQLSQSLSNLFAPSLCRPRGTAYLSIRHRQDLGKIRLVISALIELYAGKGWETDSGKIIYSVMTGPQRSSSSKTLLPAASSSSSSASGSDQPTITAVTPASSIISSLNRPAAFSSVLSSIASPTGRRSPRDIPMGVFSKISADAALVAAARSRMQSKNKTPDKGINMDALNRKRFELEVVSFLMESSISVMFSPTVDQPENGKRTWVDDLTTNINVTKAPEEKEDGNELLQSSLSSSSSSSSNANAAKIDNPPVSPGNKQSKPNGKRPELERSGSNTSIFSISSVNSVDISSYLDVLKKEKREVRSYLEKFDKDFEVEHGRKPNRDDKAPVAQAYEAYNAIREILASANGQTNLDSRSRSFSTDEGEIESSARSSSLAVLSLPVITEKRFLQLIVKFIEVQFLEKTGRKIQAESDIVGREPLYHRYKWLKQQVHQQQ